MKKRILSTALALALVLTFTIGASAAGNITLKQAYQKALKSANTTSSKVYDVDKEYDDGVYEIEFTKRSNGYEYSFEYSRKGVLLEKSVDYNRSIVTGAKKLTKAQARAKVVKAGNFKKSTVANGATYLERDDGQYIYKVIFDTSKYFYEYEVHARTGKILEWSKEKY